MTSKFKNILDAARNQPADEVDEPALQRQPLRPADDVPEASPAKRRGRPVGGKRSDPDFEQVTAYIRKDIHRRVKIALLQDDQKMEFSQLVDRLLADWLRTRP